MKWAKYEAPHFHRLTSDGPNDIFHQKQFRSPTILKHNRPTYLDPISEKCIFNKNDYINQNSFCKNPYTNKHRSK